jgi:CHAD domain-containing protein
MAKSPYKIVPQATFREAAHTAIEHQLDELMNNLEGTRSGVDIEALHDMRVASRRLRAAMSVFAAAFPEKQFKPLEREVARITDALGEVRDTDVQIEFMQGIRDAAPPSEQVGLNAFLEHLSSERERHRVVQVKELNRLEKSRFTKDFNKMLGRDVKVLEESHG